MFPLGFYNTSFCPHTSGCRGLVVAENQIELDISEHDISIAVTIPDGKTLTLVGFSIQIYFKDIP